MRGRTILIAINIDGPAWTKDGAIDQEMHGLLEHIEASVHMWDQPGPGGQLPWQPRILIGSDRMPTGLMRLDFDYKIEGLPSREEIEGVWQDAVTRAVEEASARLRLENPIVNVPSDRRHRRRFDRSQRTVTGDATPIPVPQQGKLAMSTPSSVASLPAGKVEKGRLTPGSEVQRKPRAKSKPVKPKGRKR